jgi:glycerophosphodiester phosphodiesterase
MQQQVQEGIDAVIVDSVLKIRNGLTKNAKATAAPVEETQQVNGINGVSEAVIVYSKSGE